MNETSTIDLETRTEIPDPIYSNWDHELDRTIEKKMLEEPDKFYSSHAANNHYGIVIRDGNEWIEEIRQNGRTIETMRSCGDIFNLIGAVNDKYGWD